MPSKIQLDENLWFLYICLQKSDLKSIDFNAVGLATSLKPPAARMRYTRLRRQIESGTLIGAHGTTFTGALGKSKKRKHLPDQSKGSDDYFKDGREVNVEGGVSMDRGSEEEGRTLEKAGVVKSEGREDGFVSEESSSASEDDSEDDMPLAKLRKGRMGQGLKPAEVLIHGGKRFPFTAAPSREIRGGSGLGSSGLFSGPAPAALRFVQNVEWRV